MRCRAKSRAASAVGCRQPSCKQRAGPAAALAASSRFLSLVPPVVTLSRYGDSKQVRRSGLTRRKKSPVVVSETSAGFPSLTLAVSLLAVRVLRSRACRRRVRLRGWRCNHRQAGPTLLEKSPVGHSVPRCENSRGHPAIKSQRHLPIPRQRQHRRLALHRSFGSLSAPSRGDSSSRRT